MIAEDPRSGAPIAPFRAPYALPDEDLAAAFLNAAPLSAEAEARIDARAGALVLAIRAHAGGVGGVEDFLREYSLSTKEGLALMVLAEALLRVPDAATADRLIEDKLTAGDFAAHETRSGALLVSASAWALGISARVIGHHETPEGILHELASRLGRPAVRSRDPPGDAAARLAFRARPNHRGGPCARRRASGVSLFVRHAGRRRAHPAGRRTLFRRLCGRHRGDRQGGRCRGAAATARYFGETFGPAPAL